MGGQRKYFSQARPKCNAAVYAKCAPICMQNIFEKNSNSKYQINSVEGTGSSVTTCYTYRHSRIKW